MLPTKRDIHFLMAEGQIREAVQHALAYSEACALPEAVNGLILLSSNLEEHRHQWNTGQIAYEEFARAHARMTQSLADWLDQLPDQPMPVGQRRKLLDEATFKQRIFRLIIAVKILVLSWTFYLWQTGGFSIDEAMAAFSALAPPFVAYISIMLGDMLRQHREQTQRPVRRFVSGGLINVAWWLFPLYALAQMYIINQKVQGDFTFHQMSAGLAVVEGLLGGYIGQIVMGFFKKD